MPRQRALHIDLAAGDHDLVEVESPHFVGPVEYAWECRDEDDPTVLGVGPLAGTIVPGASSLVIAGRSPLWDGFHPTLMEGAGLPLCGLEFSLMALRGRAQRPSVLVARRSGGTLQVRLEPLDPEPLWKGTHDGEGVFALLHALAARHAEEMKTLRVLAVGPAAARTRYGGVASVLVEDGRTSPVPGWFRRGGWGSRLYQLHGLCALVYGSDRSTAEIAARSLSDGGRSFLERFRPGMSLAELERALRCEWGPKLKAWGDLGATLNTLRHRMLWFNSSSVYLAEEERDELYRRALREPYLARFFGDVERAGQHLTCGELCPLRSRKLVDGRLKLFEPYASLGPQLGVADHPAADRLVRHCESLGLDALAAGGILGWLMERLHRGLADPLELGLSGRPRWSAKDFDPAQDSQHNAKLAEELASGLLFARWGEALGSGLRAAARGVGGPAAALAVYNANGESGEMVPLPYWAPGFYAPMPVSGEFYQYHGLEFVPPRVLGRKSAQRMEAELLLQNFGVCRLHRVWAEDAMPNLVNSYLETTTDWRAHARGLARSIYRRRKARFWETQRVVDIVASFLQLYQHDAAPDAELDRWVRRFREDQASAARAYWSEINAGLEEILRLMSTVKVLYHGNCFDGVVSAAIFTRFYAERVDAQAIVRYRGMGHSRSDPYGADHAAIFDADVNAVVDFRYSPSPRLHWWCDHHQTTFLRVEDEQQLRGDRSGRKRYDPAAPSCAGLLCRWLAEAHGLDVAPLSDHVRWADLIDAARFASPAQAVELREPALQLMTLLEAGPAGTVVESMIRGLAHTTIEEVWRDAAVQRALRPALAEHERVLGLFRTGLRIEQGVAFFDLADQGVEGFNKFIPYHLAQGVRYTVGVTASTRRTKISVGSNPWERPAPLVNLGELCQRYGGGGHAVVGAVTLPPGELEVARRAAREIAALLRAALPA